MRKAILFALATTISLFAIANHKIKVKTTNGIWRQAATWDLNRLPGHADTVVIPAGNTLWIDENENLPGSTLHIQVYGTLSFTINGKLSLDENSTVVVYPGGTLLGNGQPSQTLRIGNVEKYRGTSPAIVGPQLANATTGAGFINFTVLPVKFIGFNVAKSGKDALIQWSTSQEVNAAIYEVEYSTDAKNWSVIAAVQAAGNTNNTSNYAFTHKNVSAKAAYYRIKQVDLNGAFSHTQIKAVKFAESNAEVRISAAASQVVLQFAEQIKGLVEVRLVNLNGQVISRQTISQPLGQVILPFNNKGNFIIAVSNGQDVSVARQVIL